MNAPNPNKTPTHPSNAILKRTYFVYGVMILGSLFVCTFLEKNVGTLFFFPLSGKALIHFSALTLLPIGILIGVGQLFETWFISYRFHYVQLKIILGRITLLNILVLAFLSAAGEELLFRAVVQNHLGIIITSLVVGLLHLSPQGLLTAWSIFGFLSSLLLGYIFKHTHSIVPGLIIHSVLNLTFLLRIYLAEKKRVKNPSAEKDSATETKK